MQIQNLSHTRHTIRPRNDVRLAKCESWTFLRRKQLTMGRHHTSYDTVKRNNIRSNRSIYRKRPLPKK